VANENQLFDMAFGAGSLLMGMSCIKKTGDSPQHYENRDCYACDKDLILC
jgi:hypothetical protein